MYDGEWDNWKDVQNSFNMTEKEPSEVYLAWYDIDGYEGAALVAFRQGRKYGIATGSHCSCYGLEGQWAPEFYDKRTFKKLLKDRTPYRLPDTIVQEMMKKIG